MQKKIGNLGGHMSTCATGSSGNKSSWPVSAPSKGKVHRVYGDSPAPFLAGESWQTFNGLGIEAPLPVGYPSPTPPGCVEIKTYPSVRRAEIESIHAGV